MTDAELIATAALANVEAVLMAGENQMRQHQGYAPAYRDGTGMMEHGTRLDEELHRRRMMKVLPPLDPETSPETIAALTAAADGDHSHFDRIAEQLGRHDRACALNVAQAVANGDCR